MYKVITLIFLFVFTITAQDKNKISIDSKSGKPMLVGLCDRSAFADTNFAWWFDSGYKFYNLDTTVFSNLENVNNSFEVTIVLGTWCSDSRREVPRFYKIMDALNFSNEKITLITVDRDKYGDDINVDSLNIKLVPTFIIYSDGKEVGRIIEKPSETLEKDLSKIFEETSKDKNDN
jgi:thiol-disulfide isomerase/thioredoxin